MAFLPKLRSPNLVTFPRKLWDISRVAWRFLKALFLAYAVAFSIVGTILLGIAAWKCWRLYDSVAGLDDRLPEKTSFMEYREEQWRDSGKTVDVRWEPVPLSRISKNLQNAVLTGEDDRFYQHNGFDLDAMERA
ncbi:MAG TPA: transglycosylase domain-containing protein, partial [Fibrobacteria bacterium]|nr:transglycosylase domain-containing protein [Fibrobacteria bacterium]